MTNNDWLTVAEQINEHLATHERRLLAFVKRNLPKTIYEKLDCDQMSIKQLTAMKELIVSTNKKFHRGNK